ncbi:hypothetical protein XANCAGTX0491_002505 [Xanthoria calcicola]
MDLTSTPPPNHCIKSSKLSQSKFLQLPTEVRCIIDSFCLISHFPIIVWRGKRPHTRTDILPSLERDRQTTLSSTQNLALVKTAFASNVHISPMSLHGSLRWMATVSFSHLWRSPCNSETYRNSVQLWRTIYFSDTNNDALDVVWKAGLERDIFYEKRDSIEEIGWNIFDVQEHPPDDDCPVPTVSFRMRRTGLTGMATAPSYDL